VEAFRPSIDGPDQVRVIAQLEAEQDNLRTALSWAIEQTDATTALQLSANLWKFWMVRSRQTEGRDWLERSLAIPGNTPTDARFEALFAAGLFARQQGDYRRAVAWGEEGLELAHTLGNPFHTARALSLLGLVAHDQGDPGRARPLFEEALPLVRQAHDARAETMILNNLGDARAAEGDLHGAQACFEECLVITRQHGDKWGIGAALLNLGHLALRSADAQRAGELYSEGLAINVELGDQARVADYLNAIGRLAAAAGQWLAAARLLSAATALYHSLGIEQFPDHRGEHEHAVAAAKASLGDKAFTAAWDAGHALLLEQAIAEALSVTFTPESEPTAKTP
jgi:tetratricopeptide (TPR) repeat protein